MLVLLSWVKAHPELAPELEPDIAYLSSRELAERLFSL